LTIIHLHGTVLMASRRLLYCMLVISVFTAVGNETVFSREHEPVTIIEDSLFSSTLHRFVQYRAVVPAPCDTCGLRAGLLLLHGYGGDHRSWTSSVNLKEIALSFHLVIITPNGHDSWYVNSATDSLNRYDDAFVTELLPAVMRIFSIDSSKLGVAGFSMGGFGALSLGLHHPDRFRFIGALSASLDVPMGMPDLARNDRLGLKPSLESAFGKDSAAWITRDPVACLMTMDSASVPYLYLATGISDEFRLRISLYHAFIDFLTTRHVAYEFHETPGRHNWAYCQQEIGPLVKRMMSLFTTNKR
jgi:putative tributyrin esterase